MASEELKLDYYFDPFCGWCYASAPALDALAEAYPQALIMRPSGLFANTDRRPVSAMADHAWHHDQRIAKLTGQTFTTEYRDKILRNRDGIFDSICATRAIVALGETDRTLEPKVLHALQTARYVEAQETSDAEVVAAIAAAVSREHGHPIDARVFADRLANDQELAARTNQSIRETVARMSGRAGLGVPQLLATVGVHREVIHGADLYSGANAVLTAIDAVKARASHTETSQPSNERHMTNKGDRP